MRKYHVSIEFKALPVQSIINPEAYDDDHTYLQTVRSHKVQTEYVLWMKLTERCQDMTCHVNGEAFLTDEGGLYVFTGNYTAHLYFESDKDYQLFNLKNLGYLEDFKERFTVGDIIKAYDK